MKIWSKQFLLSLIALGLIAGLIRFYQLGSVPHGITWDEVAIGYNGFAVLTTRRDEWLERLPVSFRSFGDYKAPAAIYLNGLSTFVFGLTPFGVRFPFALAGVFAVLGWVLFLAEAKVFKKYSVELALLGGFLLALNPWHIHYSRIAFESGLSLSFAVWGWWLLIKLLRAETLKMRVLYSLASALFLLFSLYTYHSAKIVVPIVSLLVVIFLSKSVKLAIVKVLPLLFLVVLGLIPLLRDTIFGPGATRAGVLLFNQDLTLVEFFQQLAKNFLAQISPTFLLFGKQIATLRDGGGSWGFLQPTTFALGLLSLWLAKWLKSEQKAVWFGLSLVLIGSLPAFLATEAPHSNRGLFAVLGFIILAVAGASLLTKVFTEIRFKNLLLAKSVLGTVFLLHILLFASFWHSYFNTFAKHSAGSFQDGYLAAFTLAREYELGDNGKSKVDKIIFSSEYGQPYIYALFVRKTNPIWYRGGSLITYEFSDKISIADLSRRNTLIVASKSQDLPEERATHRVYGSDGTVRFKLYLTENNL